MKSPDESTETVTYHTLYATFEPIPNAFSPIN